MGGDGAKSCFQVLPICGFDTKGHACVTKGQEISSCCLKQGVVFSETENKTNSNEDTRISTFPPALSGT